MTKFKKTFLTIASALCCVACSALAILGLIPEKTVQADGETYETATVYDVSQLSSSGPSAGIGDASWLDGKDYAYDASFSYEKLGYTLTSEGAPKSFGIQFAMQAKNDWEGKDYNFARLFINNTEVRWVFHATDGFQLQVFDWNESEPPNKVIEADKNKYLSYTDFDKTALHTYKIIKSMKVDSTTDYKVDMYIDGSLEYTAEVEDITLQTGTSWLNTTIDKVLLRNKSDTSNTLTVKSTLTPEEVEVKDIYDYSQKNDFLVGKSLTATSTYAFDLRDVENGSYGEEENYGITFNVKLNNNLQRGEVFRFRTANFDARLRVNTATDNARFNVFDYTNSKYTTLSATVNFTIDEDAAHDYTFIRQKLVNGEKVSYLYTLAVDGDVKERIISNFAICQNGSESNFYGTFDVTLYGERCSDATFKSAKYYGVQVDGVMNKVNVGTDYTLKAPENGKFCFGFQDAQGNKYAVGNTFNSAATVTSICVGAENLSGAAVRMLHADESSLKWTTTIDKADYDALVAAYGAENVSVSYKIWTTEASDEITNTVDMSEVPVNGTNYEFYPLLSRIKASHFDWGFSYAAYITVTGVGSFEIENDNTRSIAVVAKKAYEDLKTQEQYDELSDELKAAYKYQINGSYSRYSEAQRTILSKYFANSEE